MVTLVACGEPTPTPTTPDPEPPPAPALEASKIVASPLDDLTISSPLRLGNSMSYSIVLNEQGSMDMYTAKESPSIRLFPNQPYLELVNDLFVHDMDNRFELAEFVLPSALLVLEDNDELVLGPLETASGLTIVRKVRIAEDDDVMRSLEIVHNPTSAPTSTTLRITPPNRGLLLTDETQDGQITLGDRYFGGWDDNGGAIGVVVGGAGTDAIDHIEASTSETEFTWEDVTVQPGETAIYAHFVFLSVFNSATAMREKLSGLVTDPPWAGLTVSEAAAVRNYVAQAEANIVGEVGASPSGTVTLTNGRTGETVSADVASDGQFSVVLGAIRGDSIRVDHSSAESITILVGSP